MKVGGKKTQNPSILVATYSEIIKKNLMIWKFVFFISESGKFGPFFPWKILCIG
jgi:hypothetical protein